MGQTYKKLKDTAENTYIQKIFRILRGGGYQRTLHYHNTPGSHRELYEKQIAYIADHYQTWGLTELDRRFSCGESGYISKRYGDKLSIVIVLFDGYRNNFDVMYPILEKYGQKAWFLLVADFLNCPIHNQQERLEQYKMQYLIGEYEDRRYAMNWNEALEASKNHVIVNHSSTHFF